MQCCPLYIQTYRNSQLVSEERCASAVHTLSKHSPVFAQVSNVG